MKSLRIGTRGSALALWQANHIRDKLAELHGVEAELVRIRTSGDRFQTASIAQIGGGIGHARAFSSRNLKMRCWRGSGSGGAQHEGCAHRNAARARCFRR